MSNLNENQKPTLVDVRDSETGRLLVRYCPQTHQVEIIEHYYDQTQRKHKRIRRLVQLPQPELTFVLQ